MDFRSRIIDTFINSIYLYDDRLVIYYNIKDGQQVSYIEMLDSTSAPDGDCSNLIDNGSPVFVIVMRFFGDIGTEPYHYFFM